jgi:hypothetical protein
MPRLRSEAHYQPDTRAESDEFDRAARSITTRAASPDDIRQEGWMVAVHNDYRLNGVFHTFWMFTRGSRCVKGEGRTDAEALDQVREAIFGDRS